MRQPFDRVEIRVESAPRPAWMNSGDYVEVTTINDNCRQFVQTTGSGTYQEPLKR